MQLRYFLVSALVLTIAILPLSAQILDTVPVEIEEDYSQYSNMEVIDAGSGVFCTQKVPGQSPTRLIGLSYEYQFPFNIETEEPHSFEGNASLRSASTPKIELNIPIVSRNTGILNLGAYYFQTTYQGANNVDNSPSPFLEKMTNGLTLRSMALNLTYFKPLNAKTFLLGQVQTEFNGVWKKEDASPLSILRTSATALYGRKPHDRLVWGLGVSRTFRGGEMLYVPVFMYNYTSKNTKWGTEILIPARADMRYNFSMQNMVRLGYELEGSSYHIPNMYGYSDAQLRRSEIKVRALWDLPVKDFYRAQLGVGYRIMYRFALDDQYVNRLSEERAYLREYNVAGAMFVSLNLSLVSP